jgi:hypothetical protein
VWFGVLAVAWVVLRRRGVVGTASRAARPADDDADAAAAGETGREPARAAH